MPNNQRGKRKTAEDLDFNAVVGRNIKYLRKYKGFNQTKVANHCKVQFQQLQKDHDLMHPYYAQCLLLFLLDVQ